MTIRYYPNRVYRAKLPKIDKDMQSRKLLTLNGKKDISTDALDLTLSADSDWILHSVAFQFSSSDPRDYSVKVKNGRKVVKDLNDYMWFGHSSSGLKLIRLSPGFYNGTSLASELEFQLEEAFSGLDWDVSYDSESGFFSVEVSSGKVRYLNVNKSVPLYRQDSIGGHLMGFENDVPYSNSISGSEEVFSLDLEADLYVESGNTDLSDIFSENYNFSIDQSLKITTNTAPLEVSYVINYEKI